jgi:hypothetical protein
MADIFISHALGLANALRRNSDIVARFAAGSQIRSSTVCICGVTGQRSATGRKKATPSWQTYDKSNSDYCQPEIPGASGSTPRTDITNSAQIV